MEKFLGVQNMTKSKIQMRAEKQWLSVSWSSSIHNWRKKDIVQSQKLLIFCIPAIISLSLRAESQRSLLPWSQGNI